ncbi:molybdate ABC transporter substrate-binding protein [Francisellaceae bacterium]|nr:molybdate ABC transporter substrate-binding protein [Francisellaceae bacterium]
MKKLLILIIAITLSISLLSKSIYAEQINIACAANFYTTLKSLTQAYKKQHPNVQFTIMQGSSSKLATQIENGMPIDLFLSADQTYAQTLVKRGKADKAHRYAIGEVVLITQGSPRFTSAKDYLNRAHWMHLSIANPALSPYGFQSVKILKAFGVWTKIANKVIYGEDIGQTFSYFVSHNVNAAFVALSQVKLYEKENGDRNVLVYDLKTPERLINQDAVVIKHSQHAREAESFLSFILHSPQSIKIITSMGYQT